MVGISGEHALANGELADGSKERGALLKYLFHPTVYFKTAAEDVGGGLHGQGVDIVGIFHLSEEADDVGRSKGHAQTDGRAGPCLGEGIEHNEVWKFIESETELWLC